MARIDALDVLLRPARLAAGLSQGDLAARSGVSRQAISAIESGKAAPTMTLALHLARALGCTVEDLFRLIDELPVVEAGLPEGAGGLTGTARVQVAEVGGRLVARPLVAGWGTVLTLPRANGLGRSLDGSGGRTEVRLFDDPGSLHRTAVAVGCDPAMGVLADHLQRRHPEVELAWFGGNSREALEAVGRGEAHLAGSHLRDPGSGEYNVSFARSIVGEQVRLVTFAVWQQGIMVREGNPLGIHAIADLGRADVRLANREPGSGARSLLDAELAACGLGPEDVSGYRASVRSHLAAAEAVAGGLSDAAIGVQAAALALGLDFVALARERYDLVIPLRFLELPQVHAVLDILNRPIFRMEVEALGGYDVSKMGSAVVA